MSTPVEPSLRPGETQLAIALGIKASVGHRVLFAAAGDWWGGYVTGSN